MMENTRKLLKPDEVAHLLRVHQRHLRRLVREGKFPAPIQVSERKPVWSEADVAAWIDARRPVSVGPWRPSCAPSRLVQHNSETEVTKPSALCNQFVTAETQ
jgi:prophage regulatory protein